MVKKELKNKFKIYFAKKNFKYIGAGLILLALGLFVIFYYQLIYLEAKFRIDPPNGNADVVLSSAENLKKYKNSKDVMVFEDNEFGIVIPAIGANAKVIPDVDPFNESEYSEQLNKSVAHAKGTSYPGQEGNVFVFAHSAVDFYEINNFNVYFYFLNKLEAGALIYISYQSKIYKYIVSETKLVDPSEVKYLTDYTPGKKTLTLMTCWPAGTNYKRVIVIAEEIK